MKVKITVTGKSACSIHHVGEVMQQGDLADLIREAIEVFRQACPDDSLFDGNIKIEHG